MIKRSLVNGVFLQKIVKNASWLLGGRVITGLTSLIYLSLATHHLGATGFGTLVLVQIYIQIITDLTTFKSSQAVIRYGAICLEQNKPLALQQLLQFTSILDVLGATVGLAIAIICAPYIGLHLGWSQTTMMQVQWCSLIILFSSIATPRGLLQLYNRFDLLALEVTIPTFVRMFGAIGATIFHLQLSGYLLIWVISEGLGALLLLLVAGREASKRGIFKNMDWSFGNLNQQHPGLLKFCIISNFDSSLPTVMRQMEPLVVGIFATPAAVGLFQVSYELSTPLKDLAQILTQSVYPELARLDSQKKWHLFVALLLKSTALAIGIGLVILVFVVGLGQVILKYAFGETFISAHNILVLLVTAEVFTMGNCALEPAFYAIGRPSVPLRVNAIAILAVYLPLLLILTPTLGIVGTGVATLSSTSLILMLNTLVIWPKLERLS